MNEIGTCEFCKENKTVTRTYLEPTKYKKPENYGDLYNKGDYFTYILTCRDCGAPFIRNYYNQNRIDGQLEGLFKDLFTDIEHGDDEHRNWLYNKILEFQNKNYAK